MSWINLKSIPSSSRVSLSRSESCSQLNEERKVFGQVAEFRVWNEAMNAWIEIQKETDNSAFFFFFFFIYWLLNSLKEARGVQIQRTSWSLKSHMKHERFKHGIDSWTQLPNLATCSSNFHENEVFLSLLPRICHVSWIFTSLKHSHPISSLSLIHTSSCVCVCESGSECVCV